MVTGNGPSYSIVNIEVYLAVCSLQGYQMDFETGMITIPAENVSFRVIGSKKRWKHQRQSKRKRRRRMKKESIF